MISEVRLIGFLFNWCLVTNQPQLVLKTFLKFYISNTGTTQKCPYVFTVEKSITVETTLQYSIQKYDHLTADIHDCQHKITCFLCNYDTFSTF